MDDLEWCEECQDYFPVGEDGTVLCNCEEFGMLDPHKELNFED